ncbi:hypothetical protein HPP92_005693 [Vanilla planifolia]|uniref:Uncharacterized protein n=1 Tax=Vanilla planifolia TaxID=51239 RepID=A0A835VCU8_VANPL|nr:hypothetical protein HPP92_005693 [Vanilla planifolia]
MLVSLKNKRKVAEKKAREHRTDKAKKRTGFLRAPKQFHAPLSFFPLVARRTELGKRRRFWS